MYDCVQKYGHPLLDSRLILSYDLLIYWFTHEEIYKDIYIDRDISVCHLPGGNFIPAQYPSRPAMAGDR